MANENLKSFLKLAKQADDIAKSASKTPTPKRNVQPSSSGLITSANYDQKIAELDEQIFGKYQPSQDENRGYSADAEMEMIKKRMAESTNVEAKITNPILREVLANPYEMDIDMVLNDGNSKMSQLTEKLEKKYSGLTNAKKIVETLENKDKPQVTNTISEATSIDYNLIKEIIEEVVDNKLSQFTKKINLNENVTKTNKSSMIMLGENFTFVDGEGNMYKCGDMKYVGKMKIRKK